MKAAQSGDEDVWREISSELEDAGITAQMINEHRNFITTWVIKAIDANQLEEMPPIKILDDDMAISDGSSIHSEDEPCPDATVGPDVGETAKKESELKLSEEGDSEGSEVFLNGAALKISEFHRAARESIDTSDYATAERHFSRAKDLAVLVFGEDSAWAQVSDLDLARVDALYTSRHPPLPYQWSIGRVRVNLELAETTTITAKLSKEDISTITWLYMYFLPGIFLAVCSHSHFFVQVDLTSKDRRSWQCPSLTGSKAIV